MKSNLCCLSILRCVVFHWRSMASLSEVTCLKANWPLSQQLSIDNTSLTRGETTYLLPGAMLGFLSDLRTRKSCLYYSNFCEFICTTTLLCLEATVFLYPPTISASYSPSDSLFYMIPWDLGGEMVYHLGLSIL